MIPKIARWLQLTSQQTSIIGIIFQLQENKLPTNPVVIEREYFKETKGFIQKSNLFTQLRILQEKGVIMKTENSQYLLNLRGIQEVIYAKKKELAQEMDEITNFASDTQAFFEKYIKPNSISVTYLTEAELYKQLVFYLKNASAFYIGCDFPQYAYSFALCNSAQEAAYIETLTDKIHDSSFSLFCLSPYRTEALQHRLQKKYKNRELIKEELQEILAITKKKTIQNKNIDLRKTPTPFNFALIENDEEGDALFMFLKNSNGLTSGGIFINSYETIKQTKQHFLSLMTTTVSLKEDGDFPKEQDHLLLSLSEDKPKKLIAFDVNRIFTQNHTTVELANLMGKQKEVLEFIIRQIEGTLSMQEAIIESAKLLKGLKVSDIKAFIPNLRLIDNVKAGIKELKDNGYYLVAISSGFSQIVTPICKELGIDEIYCNVLDEKKGIITGEVAEKNVLHDDVKYYIVKYIMERYSIPEEGSIGVGDGYSDIPMLKATETRICFNPSKKMIQLYKEKDPCITYLVEGQDFKGVVKTILSLGKPREIQGDQIKMSKSKKSKSKSKD